MLTQKLRPKNLHEMIGNDLNKELIRAIAKNPKEAPSTIIMSGAFGCLDGDTKIHTNFGIVSLREFSSLCEQYGSGCVMTEDGVQPVSAVYHIGVKDGYKITFKSGKTISGSGDHKFRVLRGGNLEWVKVSELEEGDAVLGVSKALRSGTNGDYSFAFILGVVLACGHKEKNGTRLVLSGVRPEVTNRIELLLSTHAVAHSKSTRSTNNGTEIQEILIQNEVFNKLFEELYVSEPIQYRKVPEWIYRKSSYARAAFVAGVYSIRGSHKRRYEITWTSEEIIDGLSTVLESLGMRTSIDSRVSSGLRYYRLTIQGKSSNRRFSETVKGVLQGEYSPYTDDEFDDSIVYPTLGNLVEWYDLHRGISYPGRISKKFFETGNISRSLFLKIVENNPSMMENETVKWIVEHEAFVDTVKSIEKGTFDMYDLTVEGSHTYLVHGLTTHNCGKCVGGETRVLTKHGYKKISDIVPEDQEGQFEYIGDEQVLTTAGWVKPSDTYYKKNVPVLTVSTMHGNILTCTPNHRVVSLTEDFKMGFFEMEKLRPGMTVLLYTPTQFFAGSGTPILDTAFFSLGSQHSYMVAIKDAFVLEAPFASRVSYLLGVLVNKAEPMDGKEACYIFGDEVSLEFYRRVAESIGMEPMLGKNRLYFSNKSTAILSRWMQVTLNSTEWKLKTGPRTPDFFVTDGQLKWINSQLRELGSPETFSSNEIDLNHLKTLILNRIPDARGLIEHPLYRVLKCFQWEQTSIRMMIKSTQDVYDLTIPGVHDYYTNGFLSHNTTSARILAKALNCDHFTDDICGECESCRADLDTAPFYTEYDVTAVGNVETIRDLRDTFYYSIPNHVRVIVFDEVHTASSKAQSALLKVFEEAPENVKFILATTDPDKLLPTIRSRSLEMNYTTQSKVNVVANLKEVSKRVGISLSDEVAELIAVRSKGHMRNAHMLLDQYTLIGEEAFKSSVRDSTMDVLKLLVALRKRNKEAYFSCIDAMLTYPLADIMEDFQQTLLNLLKAQVGLYDEPRHTKVAMLYGKDLLPIIRICTQDWVLSSFANDITLQTALLALYQLTAPAQSAQPQVNRNVKK